MAALLAGIIGLGIWPPVGPAGQRSAAKAGTPASLLGRQAHVDPEDFPMTARLMLGLTGSGPISLSRHLAAHGSLPEQGPELIAEVEQAGLRGRGGAGFPAAIKLATVAAGARPVLVVNGTEGEPMSAKDGRS